MAVVSRVPVLRQQIESIRCRDIGTSRLMESGGEIEEEPQRVVEEKIFVAVGKDVKESTSNLSWALRNSGGKKICILHVHQQAHMIPFMGGKCPANKLEEHMVRAHRELEREDMEKLLKKYLLICAKVGVRAEKLDIQMDNIGKGIVELVAQHEIRKLVMGAAADKHYSKRMTEPKSKKAAFVRQQAHLSCHIWFVCKGYLVYTREGTLDETEIEATPSLLASPITGTGQSVPSRSRSVAQCQSHHVRLTNPVQDFFRRTRSVNSELHGRTDKTLSSPEGTGEMPMLQSHLGAESSANEWEGISGRSPSLGSRNSTCSSSEVVGTLDPISVVRVEENEDGSMLPSVHESEEDPPYTSSPNFLQEEGIVNDELYDQLEQAMTEAENSKREAFEESVRRRKAEKDAIEAIRKAKASESLFTKEMKQRKEMEEVLAREKQELQNMKKQQSEVMEELQMVRDQKSVLESQIAESERIIEELEEKIFSAVELLKTLKEERDELQMERDNAVRESEELRKIREKEDPSSLRLQFFSEFSLLEIEEATCNFDPLKKIGEGGYGSVYRGLLRNTQVAIKKLHSHSLQGRAEFQQEVDVLSKVRHPNLVTLVGACPEAWSLIYEYLPNGSLEDRLSCLNNTPPLSWQTRTRIATEICSALIFLHSNNPHSIVHSDLKPANILLDINLVSKLGDFGICRLIARARNSTNTTPFHRTDPKGTFVYMDPELLSTGELTPKSDVYSFGVILLRLLTGRPALGIVKEVQYALEKGNLNGVLDESAGNWPFVQAQQLAHLALRCCEMNRRSRPDLESEVWRVLEPMKASCGASSSFRLGSEGHCRIPSYFICPVFQEIMRDPHVAADGFTYEAEAMKGWFDSGHDTSPMTNLKLAHCNLLPNRALRSVIQDWLQQP
ncbi:hypothetical protein HHK36_027707 [Tetracentron sinense]|uniref:RING-type E3 ubiquitin transferase n=1 Tax=Tetracentron sinense TaxID=13715 RepID=A0A834YH57_TETSI|nr:hypothetical protein HHK36_027707 [Tetracentron sinense]